MAKCRLRYIQDAIDDLDAIFSCIAIEDQDAALQMPERFDASISRLADAPHIEVALSAGESALIDEGHRYTSLPPYLIFYRVFENEVRIGRILHGRQNWLQLLLQRAKPSA